jgi:hypothetical protein
MAWTGMRGIIYGTPACRSVFNPQSACSPELAFNLSLVSFESESMVRHVGGGGRAEDMRGAKRRQGQQTWGARRAACCTRFAACAA